MNKEVKNLIERYKAHLQENGIGDEVYKWNLVQEFKGRPDLSEPDLYEELRSIKYSNLIYPVGVGVVYHLAKARETGYRECLRKLFFRDTPLLDRLSSFSQETLNLYREIVPDPRLSHHQDERTMATFLTFHDPDAYAFYKDSFYRKYCKLAGIQHKKKGEKYMHYLALLDDFIAGYIEPEAELLNMVQALLPKTAYQDPNHKLLAQDILYTVLDKGVEEIEIGDASVYKISMGEFKEHEIEACIQEGKVLVHQDTKAKGVSNTTQGNVFTDGVQVGDYFYLTHGNRGAGFKLLGRITGEAIAATYGNLGDEGWAERPFEVVALPKSKKVYKGTQKWWTPNDNSTCIRIKPNELKEANKLMFVPYFMIKMVSSAEDDLQEPDTSKTTDNTEEPMPIALNQILFGPPGTGKTYTMQKEYYLHFEYSAEGLREVEFVKEVRRFSWWEVIAASLYYSNPSTVPELAQRNLIKAKHQPSGKRDSPNHIIWSELQRKSEVFEKLEDSRWKVRKDYVDENHPEIARLGNLLIGKGLGVINEETRHHDFITFHQNFSYEDFIEGIKPVFKSDNSSEKAESISYAIEKGVFYQSCLKALELMGYASMEECYQDTKENRAEKARVCQYKQALFIDEINRANVSAVFGELITLIESDKRIGAEHELWVTLPYSKTNFAVPSNLFIIGTMNTADRSVEALDTALRRRFSFVEMAPQPTLLEPHFMLWRLWGKYWDLPWQSSQWKEKEGDMLALLGGHKLDEEKYRELEDTRWEDGYEKNVFAGIVTFSGLNLKLLLEKINLRVEKLLDKDHLIGHSYFLEVDSRKALRETFQNKIIPLLKEYFYGDFGKIGLVLGEGFFEQSVQQTGVFAKFDDYDASSLAERKIYNLRNVQDEESMPDDQFIVALAGLIG